MTESAGEEILRRVAEVCNRPGMIDPFDDNWKWLYAVQDFLTKNQKG